ncbi:UNVERIFIED_ORG: hypothetical protein E4P37_16585 [Bacillus sp. AZ43]
MRRPLRRPFALAAAVVVLGACGGGSGDEEAAATSEPPSSATESEPDLASGLLPAEAFGADASVVAVTAEQLQQGAGLAAAGAEGLQISPEECAAAVEGAQPTFDDFDDVAAQSATTGSGTTVEVLVRGGPTEGTVDALGAAAERCPQAQVTSPEVGQATITFETLPVDDLGDGAAMLRYTTVVALPDGSQVSVPAVIGAVEDGDRLLVLMNLETSSLGTGDPGAPATPLDPAAFADLLAQAYETQADALG